MMDCQDMNGKKKISLDEGLDLLKLCKDQLISKKRYYINFKEFII